MNRGRQGSISIGGYTVVETLIFLAVSSLIFIAAVVLVGGREARAEFQSGVRNFETHLVDVANDVATGYYKNTGTSRQCTASMSGPDFSSPSNSPLGTNINCVFVGTVLKLGDGGNRERYIQYTMAGLRESGGQNVSDLAQARPKVLDNGTGFPSSGLNYGIRVACVAVQGVNGGACMSDENAAIGFFTTFEGASLAGQGGGAVQADVINYGSQATIAQNALDAKTAINGYAGYDSVSFNNKRNKQITICLVGGSGQHAFVQIGGSASSSLTVTSEIQEGSSCS